MKGVLDKVPGVADLSAEANKGKPQLIIKVNRDAASRYGINADEILEVVQAGIGGSACLDLDRWHQALRHRRAPVRRVPGRSGPSAPYRSAPPRARSCRSRRSRPSSSTRAIPSCGANRCSGIGAADGCEGPRRGQLREGRRRGSSRQCSSRPATGSSGAVPSRTSSGRMARLAVIVPLTIGLIFMLLYTAFNSVRHATIIIANVPFAVIGGIVGPVRQRQYLSVPRPSASSPSSGWRC
jgi:cobalt-zinc-cadmium resistance protein CzcA